jgi:hypothetical protein
VGALAEATVRFGADAHAVKRELERIMLARAAEGRVARVVERLGLFDREVEVELSARLGGRARAGRYWSG